MADAPKTARLDRDFETITFLLAFAFIV